MSATPLHNGDILTFERSQDGDLNISLRPKDKSPRNLSGTLSASAIASVPNGKVAPLNGSADIPITFKAVIAATKTPVVYYLTDVKKGGLCERDEEGAIGTQPLIASVGVDSLNFVKETDGDETSAIISGKLTFVETSETIDIERSEALRTKLTRARVVQLESFRSYFRIVVSGIAQQAELGNHDHWRDVRPTYLEVAVKDKSILLFISSIVAIWGFLWGLREVFA